jgi:hypothetical protein
MYQFANGSFFRGKFWVSCESFFGKVQVDLIEEKQQKNP